MHTCKQNYECLLAPPHSGHQDAVHFILHLGCFQRVSNCWSPGIQTTSQSLASSALQKLKDELPEIKIPQDKGPNPYQDFIRTLTEAIEEHRSFFLKTQLDKTEEHVNLDVIGSIFEEEKDVVVNKMKKNFIDSPTLENFYNTQFLALNNAIKRDVDERKSANGGPLVDDYKLPLERVCSRLPPVVTQNWW